MPTTGNFDRPVQRIRVREGIRREQHACELLISLGAGVVLRNFTHRRLLNPTRSGLAIRSTQPRRKRYRAPSLVFVGEGGSLFVIDDGWTCR
jgi:hypothetical protein